MLSLRLFICCSTSAVKMCHSPCPCLAHIAAICCKQRRFTSSWALQLYVHCQGGDQGEVQWRPE